MSWIEKYYPFVARSPKKQLDWLVGACRKGALADSEITPYVRLLLANEDPEVRDELAAIMAALPGGDWNHLLRAADLCDLPALLERMPEITSEQALIILRKEPPPYENHPEQEIERLYDTFHARAPEVMEHAAAILLAGDNRPAWFADAYARFVEKLRDKEFLSELYPKAKG
ncbi:MAG: hypothetical protein AB1568_13695 [Thermodesulfobacteriota bacterium]